MRIDERLERKFAAGAVAVATVLAGLLPSTGFGHSRLKVGGTLPPRSTSAGLKTGPCGNIARGTTATKLVPGQSLTVQIEEVIEHPGYFRVAFSKAGDAFPAALPPPTDSTPPSAELWVPFIKKIPGTTAYEATVKVPDVECTDCSVQLIQYMTENDPPSMYYSCADIEISKDSAPVPPPTATPSATPSPECR